MDVLQLRERCEALASAVVPSTPLTVEGLAERFLSHAQTYYGTRIGSTEATNFRDALRYCRDFYGELPADDFAPRHLKAVRQALILQGLARSTINARVRRIRHVWRWGVSEGLVSPATLQRLEAVPPLKRGRSDARETPKVRPVVWELVAATLPHLPQLVQSMVLLQWHTGMRPGEVCAMRPCDLETANGQAVIDVMSARISPRLRLSSSVISAITPSAKNASIDIDALPWVYRPTLHKNAWRGLEREIYLGRAAVKVVTDALGAYSHSIASRFDAAADAGIAGRIVSGSTENKTAALFPYRQSSYYNAVRRACRRAKVEHWAVGQLRHAFKQRAEKALGIEATRVLMGHANVNTTELYGERDAAAAREAVLKLG